MQISFLFVFTGLILTGYLFEILSPKTRIPNILILLGLGMLSQQLVETFHWQKPNFDKLLPELGTVGLILIVLEGTLELNLTRSKIPLLKKTVSLAFFSIVSLSLTFGAYFFYQGYPIKQSILNALPLTIISSAIAIPTAKMLSRKDKEFIIFESSLSDILGVTIFNFFLINEVVNIPSLINFGGEIIISLLFSIAAAIMLIFVLSRLKHKVKFMPIIALVLFLYAFAKGYHLPGLILILTFGLVLANIEKLNLIPFLKDFNITHLKSEITRFEEITVELTFLVRVAFFLIFGFTIELSSLLDLHSLLLSMSGFFIIIFFRVVQLLLMKLPLLPLAFVAPRGLITILLFVSIPSSNKILFINQTVITQVIIISSLFMMIATMTERDKTKNEELNP
jgi:Kef-type K+ transport system membrane component KefB